MVYSFWQQQPWFDTDGSCQMRVVLAEARDPDNSMQLTLPTEFPFHKENRKKAPGQAGLFDGTLRILWKLESILGNLAAASPAKFK